MQNWLKLSLWIGTFGFLKEFRPEDPYITQYLVGPVMNLTEAQVNQEIYPVATYVCLAQLVVIFLLTDWLRYKPIIVMNAFSGVVSQAILIWGRGVPAMQAMEFFYGTMTACEVAYYTYIYAKVDKQHYQVVTSHMRAAALSGRFISATTSQTVLSFGIMDVAQLNHLTLVGMCAAFLWALSLPSLKHSLYFHRAKTNQLQVVDENTPVNREEDHGGKCSEAITILWEDFKYAYTNPYVIKWSFWWALATCGYMQVMTYVQLLWIEIGGKQQVAFNGAVEAVYTVISASAALSFGWVNVDWRVHGEILLSVCTLIEGALLLSSAVATSIVHAYAVYVLFGMLYHIMMTVANSEVARQLKSDSYALIFGVNTFIALILQSCLTFAVAGNGGLTLNSRQQYVVYGVYFVTLGSVFAVKALVSLFWRKISRSSTQFDGCSHLT